MRRGAVMPSGLLCRANPSVRVGQRLFYSWRSFRPGTISLRGVHTEGQGRRWCGCRGRARRRRSRPTRRAASGRTARPPSRPRRPGAMPRRRARRRRRRRKVCANGPRLGAVPPGDRRRAADAPCAPGLRGRRNLTLWRKARRTGTQKSERLRDLDDSVSDVLCPRRVLRRRPSPRKSRSRPATRRVADTMCVPFRVPWLTVGRGKQQSSGPIGNSTRSRTLAPLL